jgi:hypothetical protein
MAIPRFHAFLLAMASAISAPSAMAQSAGPDSAVRREDCPVVSRSLPGDPTCIADVGMVASDPDRYCGKKIELVGYLDRSAGGFFASHDLARLSHLFLAVVIADESVAEHLASTGVGDVQLAIVSGTFDCGSRHEFPTVGSIKDIVDLVVYPRGSGQEVLIDGSVIQRP